MKRISVLADKNVAEHLELQRNMRISVVSDRDEAIHRFCRLRRDASISIIMVSEKVLGWIESSLSTCSERENCPILVSLMGKGSSRAKASRLSRLMARIVGPG